MTSTRAVRALSTRSIGTLFATGGAALDDTPTSSTTSFGVRAAHVAAAGAVRCTCTRAGRARPRDDRDETASEWPMTSVPATEKVWSTIRWSSASGTFGGKDSRAAWSAATLGLSACTSRQSSSSCVVAREREAERQVGERAAESGDEQEAALLQLGERELVPLQAGGIRRMRWSPAAPAAQRRAAASAAVRARRPRRRRGR